MFNNDLGMSPEEYLAYCEDGRWDVDGASQLADAEDRHDAERRAACTSCGTASDACHENYRETGCECCEACWRASGLHTGPPVPRPGDDEEPPF